MAEPSRFLSCPGCARPIAATLARCPYCRQETWFPPPPTVPPPVPPPALPEPPPRHRTGLWIGLAALLVAAAAGLTWFLASRDSGRGGVCSALAGQTPVVQYLRLVAAYEEAPESPGWDAFLAEATAACPYAVGELLDLRPGLASRPPDVEWRIGPGVASWEEDAAAEMVLGAQAMVGYYAGEPLAGLTVYMDTDRATLAQFLGRPYDEAYELLGEGVWFGGNGAIYVNLSQQRLQYPYDYPVVAHEVMHVFQQELMGPAWSFPNPSCRESDPGIGGEGPAWIVEGTAEQIGWSALADSPYWPLPGYSPDPADLFDRVVARGLAAAVDLEDLSSWEVWDAQDPEVSYGLAYAGAAALEDLADRDMLFDYFRRVGRGECWQGAFAASFGLTPGDFYARFERQRPQPGTTA